MAAATCLFRCRKCRERVFDSRCVVTVHGEQHPVSDGSAVLPSGVSCQDVAMETVWYITDDSAPAWIVNNIETALWTKGKLLCPKCGGRLGSFDFTKTVKCACAEFTVPPIHILQCRVDVSTNSATWEIQSFQPSRIVGDNITVDKNNESEQHGEVSSSNPGGIFSSDISTSLSPKKKTVPVDHSSAVTFDPDLTSTLDSDNHFVDLSTASLPRSEKTSSSSRSFGKVNLDTLPLGAERSFRDVDLVTFDPDLTSTLDSGNHSVDFSTLSLPSSEKTSSRSFGEVNLDTLGAESSFREVDLDREKRRSLDDVNYSPTFRTRSSVSKLIGIKTLHKPIPSESDVHLQYVLDQSDGNRKSEKMEVKENCFKGDNLQQTGNQQQESQEIRILADVEPGAAKTADSSKSGQGHSRLPDGQGHNVLPERQDHDMLPEGQGHNMLHEGQGHNMLPEGQGNQDFSEDESPSGLEHAEGPCHSDVMGDDQRYLDTTGVVKQRNRRKHRKRNTVASPAPSPADNDQNDVVNPVYPEEHTCPICLDLYCHPMRTSPCDHVFCDPCLRRLARATPVNTPCPLCRRVISKCHGEDELTLDLKTWYAVLYKKRQVMENKFRNNSYHKLPESNSSDLLPNMARIGQYPRQAVWERNNNNWIATNLPSARNVIFCVTVIVLVLCNNIHRFRMQMAAAPLSLAGCVMAAVFLIAVFGFICLEYVIGYAFRMVGSLFQVLGQAIVEFVGSVFMSPHVESFQSESSQSLLPTSVRIRAMTANFFLIVIVVIVCRYVFFRRVFYQLGRNV